MAPFTAEQLAYLSQHFASKPHTHLDTEIIVDTDDDQRLDNLLEVMAERIDEIESDEETDLEETDVED